MVIVITIIITKIKTMETDGLCGTGNINGTDKGSGAGKVVKLVNISFMALRIYLNL